LGVAQWGAYNSPSAAFFLLPTRGWELLVGVFAAFYLKYNTHLKSHILNQALSLLGFGMIAYSIIAFDKTTPFPSLYALIPTIGTGLLILCAVPKTFVHKLLTIKVIVGIGLISYSAYLWHQPLLAFARYRLLGEVSGLIIIVLCISSMVIAWFSWRFVERPFRSRTGFSRNFVFRFSILCMSIFSLIGIYTHSSNDSSNRWYKGLDSWIFLGNQYNQTVAKSKLQKVPSINEINGLKRTFNEISIVAEKSNTQIALLVVPNKSTIYDEKLPPEISVSPTRYVDFFLNELSDIVNLIIYDPTEDLKNAKKSEGLLYYRTDTHWNDKGAYIAFKNLLLKLELDAPDVYFSLEESTAGDLVDLSKIKELSITKGDRWLAEINHAHKLIRIEDDNLPSSNYFGIKNTVINSNAFINNKIWIVGDSFTNALKPYFEATFSEVRYLGHWNTELDILASKLGNSFEKPDLIVVVRVERSF
jgi:hypothetical protein